MYRYEILDRDLEGNIVPLLGSDGSGAIDGRFGHMRADYEAMDRYLKLKHVKPYIIGYRLIKNGTAQRNFIFEEKA